MFDEILTVLGEDDLRIGAFEKIISIQWVEMFQDCGEAKVVVADTERNAALVNSAVWLILKDSKCRAIIRNVMYTESDEEKTITIRARLAADVLRFRVYRYGTVKKNAEAAMYDLVRWFADDVVDIAPSEGYAVEIEDRQQGGTVLDGVKEVASSSGLGFTVSCDYDTVYPGAITDTFRVYSGTDRTTGLMNFIGVFSRENGMISNIVITHGEEEYCTRAIVVGEVISEQVVVEIVDMDPSVTGKNRKDLYVDATGYGRNYTQQNPDGTVTTGIMTEEEYRSAIRAYGRSELVKRASLLEVSCTLTNRMLTLNKNFFLGDLIMIDLGREEFPLMTAKITQVLYVYEPENTRIDITLTSFAPWAPVYG